MKLLLVFAFLALICMARSAPAVSTTQRVLILPDYHGEDDTSHDVVKPHEDGISEDDDDEETTTTTRRTTYALPTRNRNLIPSRRPIQTQRTTSVRTTTIAVDDEEQGGQDYDGDFKYIRDFRKYVQQLMEDIKKLVRNLTGYDFDNTSQGKKQQQYNHDEED